MTVTNRESGKTAIKSGECAIGTSKLGSTGRKFTVLVPAVLFLWPHWRLTCKASRATTRWAPISILGWTCSAETAIFSTLSRRKTRISRRAFSIKKVTMAVKICIQNCVKRIFRKKTASSKNSGQNAAKRAQCAMRRRLASKTLSFEKAEILS